MKAIGQEDRESGTKSGVSQVAKSEEETKVRHGQIAIQRLAFNPTAGSCERQNPPLGPSVASCCRARVLELSC